MRGFQRRGLLTAKETCSTRGLRPLEQLKTVRPAGQCVNRYMTGRTVFIKKTAKNNKI